MCDVQAQSKVSQSRIMTASVMSRKPFIRLPFMYKTPEFSFLFIFVFIVLFVFSLLLHHTSMRAVYDDTMDGFHRMGNIPTCSSWGLLLL
jgi:hypothetical protein